MGTGRSVFQGSITWPGPNCCTDALLIHGKALRCPGRHRRTCTLWRVIPSIDIINKIDYYMMVILSGHFAQKWKTVKFDCNVIPLQSSSPNMNRACWLIPVLCLQVLSTDENSGIEYEYWLPPELYALHHGRKSPYRHQHTSNFLPWELPTTTATTTTTTTRPPATTQPSWGENQLLFLNSRIYFIYKAQTLHKDNHKNQVKINDRPGNGQVCMLCRLKQEAVELETIYFSFWIFSML